MVTKHQVVEVEADVVQFLRQRQHPQESVSEALRRLLRIPSSTDHVQALLGEGFWKHDTIIGRLLWVLRSLYHEDPVRFVDVLAIRGKDRIYFARKREDIVNSGGEVTYPRRIPDTPFWACSAFNERQKMSVLHRVLDTMGYGSRDERSQVVKAVMRGRAVNP